MTRRRWFRFSLRTLFVVAALVACGAAWVGAEVRFVRQRNAFYAKVWAVRGDFKWVEPVPDNLKSKWHEWLGDAGPVERICVPHYCADDFRAEAERLFPEASFVALSKEEIEERRFELSRGQPGIAPGI
jgi:hypothetical protein